jgi:hypothetical protein
MVLLGCEWRKLAFNGVSGERCYAALAFRC